ncbi:spore-associated protein A [Kitasatospora sp. NPDC058965]|uniref:spore-associated protein A n=1 Tax=Kitasatospora sp. NPDC058965 TaxID=3346682 RepID=UPI00367C1F09
MHRTTRRLAARAAVAALLAATAALGWPGAASAAGYNGACGAGYSVIDSKPLNAGTVFLTWNSSTGQNCVVTIRNTPGPAQLMSASIRLSGSGQWTNDVNYFTTYAGPVKVTAPGHCIDWQGAIEDNSAGEFDSHCN